MSFALAEGWLCVHRRGIERKADALDPDACHQLDIMVA